MYILTKQQIQDLVNQLSEIPAKHSFNIITKLLVLREVDSKKAKEIDDILTRKEEVVK